MKRYYPRTPSRFLIACCLTASLLPAISCSKERTLAPSYLDENYFVIKDNPNDPVDHAIYTFYSNTGIASFFNDTIHKKRIGDSAGLPRYSYIKLSLSYTPFNNQLIFFKPVSNKNSIPALLHLLEQELVSRLPKDLLIPSFFLVDSIWTTHPVQKIDIADGWTSWFGFNTVAISVKEVNVMNADERKMYAASLLAGIAEKRLKKSVTERLNSDFFSVSKAAASAMTSTDIYSGNPLFYLNISPSFPPQKLGFMRYFRNELAILMNLPDPVGPPTETDDLRAFLTAVFQYTPQEFTDKYADSPHMQKKFNALREIAKNAGFRFPG